MTQPEPRDQLFDVARRIDEELSIDWEREEAANPKTRSMLKGLRSLETLARIQRHAREGGDRGSGRTEALFHWGPLRVLDKLGEGGFAEVYRAWDPALEREVALKLRRGDPEGVEGSARSWLEEARRLARVRHPHVVSIYGSEIRDGRVGMWMERVEGKTLEEVLADHGPLSAREAALIGVELCGALAAVHAAGILHGDVKTTNVMRERGGRIVLMDFGAGSERLPGDSVAVVPGYATPLISAPEVLRGGAPLVESDLYALGSLLYRLVTGRYHVAGATFDEVRERLERGEVTPLRDARPDLPHPFVEVVSRALETSPGNRFSSAGAMEAALARAVGGALSPKLAESGGIPAASIAVLPLLNLGDESSSDYFADGLAEELLLNLARIRGLRVAGRTSSFQFKGTGHDLNEVGRRLNVETVLEGSVRRAGNRVRIAIQLVHAAEGHQLWSRSYDRELGDIFAIQEDIARSVAAALKTALLRTGASSPRQVAPDAYDALLLGRYFHRRGSGDDLKRALGYFGKAIEIDPLFALAWTGLGLAHIRLCSHGHAPLAEGYRTAREAARRAIDLEPDLPDAHTLLGMIHMEHDWDWEGSDREYRAAMDLDPGHAGCNANAAWLANTLGRHEEALELSRRASELDPLSVSYWSNRGMLAWYAGRSDEAIAMYRRAMELDPAYPLTHAKLGRVYLTTGQNEQALAEALAEKNDAFRLQALAMSYHALGRAAESDAALAELIERFETGGAFQIADVYAFREEHDPAFSWLDRAYAQRDTGLISMKSRPLMKSLEDDSRWSEFLRKMRLPVSA
jgi:TolB-like protein/Flp pilus assembly protein TadD